MRLRLQELQLLSSQCCVLSSSGSPETHALAVLFRSSAGTLRRRWFVGNRLGLVLELAASGLADDMVFKDYSPRRLALARGLSRRRSSESQGHTADLLGRLGLVINATLVLT
jgi:hypothetical protein